jgi:small subunit ribosomal protein S9
LIDDEQTPEETPAEETPAEETPAEEAPAEEAPSEGAPAEEVPAEEATAEESPAEPGTDDAVPDQEVPAEEDQAPTAEPADAEAETPEPEQKQPEQKQDDKKQKKEEVVPGAELDPIAIESDRPLSAEEKARREAEEEERRSREAALTADAPDDAPVAHKPTKLEGDARFIATGKRKSSVARVILTPGDGAIEVNKRELEQYFPRPYLQTVAKQALVQSGYEGNVNVRVRVHGGGVSGQAAAVRHGIAKALVNVDPELRGELKRRGMLTRDARVKERRKAGLKKARKRPQFSKR